MKMFIFNSFFWGALLIVFGVVLIIKYIFNIDFPVIRTFFALFIILLGIQILIGNRGKQSQNCMFAESNFDYVENQGEYNCVFGKSTFDLSNIEITENTNVKLSCVFGEFIVIINPESNIEINSSSAFGNLTLPNKNSHNFGSGNFRTKNFDKNKPYLKIKAEVAFGNMEIKPY